ncbi:MAG: hypothetical protein P4L50_05840 [Anaerolineaceae bacterium]|nr:hypothetical protein [Anaerolineaceae bacterium]
MKQSKIRQPAFLLIILVLALSVLGPETALAQPSAASATWSSDIIYFNLTSIPVDSKNAPIPKNLTVAFNGSGTSFSQADQIFYQYYSNTILAGSIGKNFAGSAVVSAEVPVVAVYKQVSSSSNPYSPILYTSFSADQAGNGIFYIPSVQRSSSFVSQIGVQNIEAVALDISVDFYPEGGGSKITFALPQNPVASQNSAVFKLSDLPGFPMNSKGSLVIHAAPHDNGSSSTAYIAAVVQEVQGNGRQAYAYEGAASGAPTIYMPSAMCSVGKTQQTTYYAIQNVASSDGTATITYYDGMGNPVASMTTGNIPAYSKVSVSTCGDPTSPTYAQFRSAVAGKSVMSAVITGNNLVAMGKVQSNDGLMTAFLGSNSNLASIAKQADGKYHVALPYVEWSNSTLGFRSYIAVMNASTQPVTSLAINYYRRGAKGNPPQPPKFAGQQLAGPSTPLAVNAKRNSEPDQVADALDNSKSFLGAVEVLSDQPVVVVVRVQRGVSGIPGVTTLGEDYSGINIPPSS